MGFEPGGHYGGKPVQRHRATHNYINSIYTVAYRCQETKCHIPRSATATEISGLAQRGGATTQHFL